MQQGKLVTILLIILAGLFLAAGAWRLGPLNDMRTTYKMELVNPMQVQENVGKQFHIPLVALFTFRSLAIDYLWIRAEDLKDQGQYFDALQLANMICTLQPYIAKVWDFQAWNMAYNISVGLPTAAERWHWVQAGYELIRDKGLKFNPHNIELYHSIAWIFKHKIGGITDDYNRDYKLELAIEMTPVLRSLIGGKINSLEDFKAMAAVTKDWKKLSSEPEMKSLLKKIRAAQPDFTTDEKLWKGILDIRLYPNRFQPDLHQLLSDNRNNPALKKLDAFVRARQLRRQWKMDPKIMQEINNKYGPINYKNLKQRLSLEWRSPFAHAIYWAYLGLKQTHEKTGFDVMQLYRDVYQSLMSLYNKGRIQIISFESTIQNVKRKKGQEILSKPTRVELRIFNSQDLRMFPAAYDALLEIFRIYKEAGKKISEGTEAAFANMTWSAIQSYYLAGYRVLAQQYYDKLRKRFPSNPDYRVNLDRFVQNRMRDEMDALTPKKASNYIISLLRDQFYYIAIGNDEIAGVRQTWAKQVYDYFKKKNPITEDPTQRLTMPPFADMNRQALMDLLTDPLVNPDIIGALLGRLERSKPELYKSVMNELQKRIKETGS